MRLDIFEHWLAVHNVWLDDRLHLVSGEHGISVVAQEDISERDAAAIIPKSAILSIRSSYIEPYTRHLRALSGPKATLALTFVLHAELLKGSQSSWWGYLQSLPDPPPSLPIFWSSNTQANADALQAASWAAGTEIWKELHADIHHSTTYEDICSYYHSEANGWMKGSSILRDHPYLAQSTLAGFCNAYALVSSRSFIVDVYHGLAMVPIADAFNHTNEHHIHMESDFDVCLECGSADECEHDRADQADGMKRSPSSSDVENTCEMVTNAFIPAGAEVFNIYGPLLGNAQLICHYGFALDGNEHDVVSWDAAELADALPSTLHETQRRYAAELREWRQDAPSWEDSDLIFVIDRRESSPARSHLVDADGCISRELWIWAAATALAQETSSMNTLPAAANLADEQIRLERQLEVEDQMDEDDEHESGALDDEHDPVAIVYLLIIFEVLTSIIVTRETKLRRGKSLEEIESLLDELPTTHERLRLVLIQVVVELSILQACVAKLEALAAVAASSGV